MAEHTGDMEKRNKTEYDVRDVIYIIQPTLMQKTLPLHAYGYHTIP